VAEDLTAHLREFVDYFLLFIIFITFIFITLRCLEVNGLYVALFRLEVDVEELVVDLLVVLGQDRFVSSVVAEVRAIVLIYLIVFVIYYLSLIMILNEFEKFLVNQIYLLFLLLLLLADQLVELVNVDLCEG